MDFKLIVQFMMDGYCFNVHRWFDNFADMMDHAAETVCQAHSKQYHRPCSWNINQFLFHADRDGWDLDPVGHNNFGDVQVYLEFRRDKDSVCWFSCHMHMDVDGELVDAYIVEPIAVRDLDDKNHLPDRAKWNGIAKQIQSYAFKR